MAIYAIGAKYGADDISTVFITDNIAGIGWEYDDAPDLHEYVRSICPGDIVYLKSGSFSSDITIIAIGIVVDEQILSDRDHGYVTIGRNVRWIYTNRFRISRPANQKNNVRLNSIYREFHPDVINQIMDIVNENL